MPESRQPIRVLICEDDTVMQELVRGAIDACDDMELVGSAGNGSDAVALALECEPDVIVMDVVMPRFDGVEATRRISAALPQTHIVIFTGHHHADLIDQAFVAGAVGYVTKPQVNELIAAIRNVSHGRSVLNFPPSPE